MKELPIRKKIRFDHYVCSSAGYDFITICVKDRLEMFAKIDVGANCVRPCLSAYGLVVEKEMSILSETYDAVKIDKHVVMPNHIHMIITIDNDNCGRTQFAPTISRIIKQFKGSITKHIGFSLWQKSYHDHIIRNEAEYQKIWQYIDEDPVKWEDDCYYGKH